MGNFLPNLVKGSGYKGIGNVRPWSDNDERITTVAAKAEVAIRDAVHQGKTNPKSVIKGFSPEFNDRFGSFIANQPQNVALENWSNELVGAISAAIGKNISLTSPLSSGFVPYDLLAPSRLIYPVYSPMRNKLPRPAGQGTERQAKLIPGISGSRTGGSSNNFGKSIRWSISEFDGGSFSSWPNSLPASGTQDAVDLKVPYKFFGLTESLTWLAQFSGQGFEDISSLANLILLQESMIAEEDAIFSATGAAVQTPGAPSLTARAAVSGEKAMTGVVSGQNVYVYVTATNYYGETVPGSVGTVMWTTTLDVIDVTISPSRGAFQYNIYANTGTTNGGTTASHLYASGVGGALYTLQGAFPTSTATPPTADTGTSSTNDYEGLLSVIDAHAITDASVYPTGFSGVGVNKSAGTWLNIATVNSTLEAMWDTGSSADGVAGAFRANPGGASS